MEHLRNILRHVLSLHQDTFHTFSLLVLHNLLYVLLLKNTVKKLIFVVDTYSLLSDPHYTNFDLSQRNINKFRPFTT